MLFTMSPFIVYVVAEIKYSHSQNHSFLSAFVVLISCFLMTDRQPQPLPAFHRRLARSADVTSLRILKISPALFELCTSVRLNITVF